MPGPITPDEVVSRQIKQIPEFVFEVFNHMIAQNWSGISSTVNQSDIRDRIKEAQKLHIEYRHLDLYEQNWLDVEDAYRAAGWLVNYNKPGYSDTYEAYFEFSKATL